MVLAESAQLDRPTAEQIARRLRAVADPTRVQLLRLIVDSTDGRRPVTELARQLELTQPTVSHHLRVLTDEGVLDRERLGRQVWYSVAPSKLSEVIDAISVGSPASPPIDAGVLSRVTDTLATRFRGTFSPETVGAYVRESWVLLSERAGIIRHLPSLTTRFAGDRLRALASAERPESGAVPEVLFVCVQNAGRSQLASAILRSLAGDSVRVSTAGSAPSGVISPVVIAALDEIGVPIDGEFSKPLTDEMVRAADFVITMGCGDACPVYPGRRYLDWDLPDPALMQLDDVRTVRDDIERRVRELLDELALAGGSRVTKA